MNPEQPTPTNYSDEKVENGRVAVAHILRDKNEDVIVTYWGNDKVFERAFYLLERIEEGVKFHLQHMETGTYDVNGVSAKCYANDELPPKLKENVPLIQRVMEGFLK